MLKSMVRTAVLLFVWTVGTPARSEVVQFSVKDTQRPIATAIKRLETREGWTITYEEPLVSSSAPGSIEMRYTVTDSTRGDPKIQEQVLRQLVEQQAHGKDTAFRLANSGTLWHVIPAQGSPLDAPLSLSRQERPLGEVLREFCAVVGKATGTRIELGRSAGLTLEMPVALEATKEPARTVLARALASSQRPIVWNLLRDDELRGYVLSLHPVFRIAGSTPPSPHPEQSSSRGTLAP